MDIHKNSKESQDLYKSNKKDENYNREASVFKNNIGLGLHINPPPKIPPSFLATKANKSIKGNSRRFLF